MAFSFDVNQASQASNLQMYRLKVALLAAGWTVDSSGTGSSGTGSGVYSAAGDVVTSAALLGNTQAWFVLKRPGTQSRFCFQFGSTGSAMRLKYAVAPFTGGSPSASIVPSASGEVTLVGGNTDASPTLSFFTDSPNRSNIIVGDASENYAFLYMNHQNGVSGLRCALLFDGMKPASHPAEDTEPNMAFFSSLNTGVMNFDGVSTLNTGVAPVVHANSTRITRVGHLGWLTQGANVVSIPGALGVDVMTGEDLVFPAMVGRYGTSGAGVNSAAPAYKGVSSIVHWNGINRAFGDTLNIGGGTKNYLVIGGTTTPAACNVVIPWNGTDLTI